MRYNKNYKFTRIIIERVVIMVMDNNLKSALKSENFFEEYQTGIINLFDSFDSTIVLEFDADEIIDGFQGNNGENLINKLRKRKSKGKILTSLKEKIIKQLIPSINFSFKNKYILFEQFEIENIESKIEMEVSDRAVSEYVPYYVRFNLQEYKYNNAVRYFLRPKNFLIECLLFGEPFHYGIRIDNKNVTFNTLTSEVFLAGKMAYDPTGELDDGLGATIYNDDNQDLSVNFCFSAYAVYAPSPRWLETLVESIQFYDAGMLFDSLFKLFSSLDHIIELAYTYIETLHCQIKRNCSIDYGNIVEVFEKKYIGQKRRLIDEKLKCILDMCEISLEKRNIFVNRFNKYQKYRNDIAHGEPLEDLSFQDAYCKILEIMNEFYYTYFDFIYEITYGKSLVDCIELRINYTDFEYQDSY